MVSNKTDEAQESIIAILKEKFEDQILLVEDPYSFLTITVKREKIIDIIQFLYDKNYQYLTTLCAIHYPELKQIAMMYQVHNLVANQRIRLKIYLPEEDAVTPTLTTIFSAANWLERETYDFYGVQFTGHPDLRRILNVDDMVIFPMRKEYPLEDQTREDKDNKMFGR